MATLETSPLGRRERWVWRRGHTLAAIVIGVAALRIATIGCSGTLETEWVQTSAGLDHVGGVLTLRNRSAAVTKIVGVYPTCACVSIDEVPPKELPPQGQWASPVRLDLAKREPGTSPGILVRVESATAPVTLIRIATSQ